MTCIPWLRRETHTRQGAGNWSLRCDIGTTSGQKQFTYFLQIGLKLVLKTIRQHNGIHHPNDIQLQTQ